MEGQLGQESTITVAAVQTRAITGAKHSNNERAFDAIHQACDEGAQLLVLLELGTSRHVSNTRDEVASRRRRSSAARRLRAGHGGAVCEVVEVIEAESWVAWQAVNDRVGDDGVG